MRLSTRRLHRKPSAKDGKGKYSLVVSLLPGSHEHLASRNPRILCQKHGGACTTYQLGVPRYEKRDEKSDYRAAEEGREVLVHNDVSENTRI